jgi:GH25 family lysozyme M1 (1,4-beta-N-acetylmuramidase)
MAAKPMCRGIDISDYQHTQNWADLKADGVVFAMAKASEGQHSRDNRFATHISGIKENGLVPGAYHFGWPNQDVHAEAENYVGAVKSHAGNGFTHWLDLERYSDGRNYSGRGNTQIHDWAQRWIQLVQQAFPGQRVGIYTSGDDIAKGHAPSGVPLWYPRYPWTGPAGYAKAEAASRPEPSGRQVLFWQFTSTPIDRNLCYMSAAELRAWAGAEGSDEEDDDVPIRTSLGKNADQAAAWGEWTKVNWDAEYQDPQDSHAKGNYPGYVSPLSSWADFNGRLVIEGVPVGGQVQVRYEVVGWKDGGPSGRAWTETIADVQATPGAQFISVPFSKGLAKGQHVYVSVLPIAPDDSSGLAAPKITGGRWAIRQDK